MRRLLVFAMHNSPPLLLSIGRLSGTMIPVFTSNKSITFDGFSFVPHAAPPAGPCIHSLNLGLTQSSSFTIGVN